MSAIAADGRPKFCVDEEAVMDVLIRVLEYVDGGDDEVGDHEIIAN